jgi:hypothetical protein
VGPGTAAVSQESGLFGVTGYGIDAVTWNHCVDAGIDPDWGLAHDSPGSCEARGIVWVCNRRETVDCQLERQGLCFDRHDCSRESVNVVVRHCGLAQPSSCYVGAWRSRGLVLSDYAQLAVIR